MIYLVTGQELLFDNDFQLISIEESLNIMKDWNNIQYDIDNTVINMS